MANNALYKCIHVMVLAIILRVSQGFTTTPASGDLITSLQGLTTMPNFPMYSGYLDVTESKKFHYWYNACAERNCNNLIIWFNGGPGCSSMDGLLEEHGPYQFHSQSGELIVNEYSWNKMAHTLYIESPSGVGFSYDLNSPSKQSDLTTAKDNLEAILNFFEKFPNLKNTDVYITGESYAGVYVPTLASEIIDSNSWLKDRLKGFIIGNGLLSRKWNSQSLVYFAYYHGIFGTSLWNELLEYCCEDSRPDRCEFFTFRKEECVLKVAKVAQLIANNGLNMYNLYDDCFTGYQMNMFRLVFAPYMKRFEDFPKAKSYLQEMQNKVSLVPPCTNASKITNYLNNPDVQRDIHVKRMHWELCSDDINANYNKLYHDMNPFFKKIIDQLDARILLYFGDTDMACNFMGGEWFADKLGLKIITPRRKWSIISEDGTKQVSGFLKEFYKLTYAIVKGAGHMVPIDKPKAIYLLVKRFLNDEPI